MQYSVVMQYRSANVRRNEINSPLFSKPEREKEKKCYTTTRSLATDLFYRIWFPGIQDKNLKQMKGFGTHCSGFAYD